jgi:EAL domain-containing protein (putative c-di-GMP-specific phosphodiesterase class I)
MGEDKSIDSAGTWYLEGFVDESKRMWRVPIRSLPFRVGRRPDVSLSLPAKSISQDHAEFIFAGEVLRVRDLNSTNGTFINRQRIRGEAELQDGDIIHFATLEFRVSLQLPQDWATTTNATRLMEGDLPRNLASGTREFQQMLRQGAIVPFYQPIVAIDTGKSIGYEVLGRGNFEGLPTSPGELFLIAASLSLESELSRVFRARGVEIAKAFPEPPILFVNTHPAEGHQPGLLESLQAIRQSAPLMPITLEVHEGAVTNLAAMHELRASLRDLRIGLAYDDFGAGQARLVELVEVPPDYLKFDIGLVRDIHRAPKHKQQMLETLVRLVRDMGIAPLAEGIETAEEAKVCLQMGFEYAQGYHFGKPKPIEAYLESR